MLLQGVRHSYRGAPPVLVDVDVEVGAGDLLVVHGRNGAGKTTLLRVMAGLLRPRSGTVQCRGRVGYLPQRSDEPPPRLSAAAWLDALAGMAGHRPGPDRPEILRAVGLDRPASPMDTLSVGTVAKVLIAGAVAGAPDVLVLDEPLAALDAAARDATLSLLVAAARDGAAVVVSDHDGAAAGVATHVATISGGRLTVAAAGRPSPRVRIVAARADGTGVDLVVPVGEREAALLELLRDGAKVLRVEDVP